MGLRKEDAEVMSALTHWLENQSISPRDACVAMSGLCAVIIARVARNEEDCIEGIACCAKDMLELGIAAHRESRKK